MSGCTRVSWLRKKRMRHASCQALYNSGVLPVYSISDSIPIGAGSMLRMSLFTISGLEASLALQNSTLDIIYKQMLSQSTTMSHLYILDQKCD